MFTPVAIQIPTSTGADLLLQAGQTFNDMSPIWLIIAGVLLAVILVTSIIDAMKK